MGSSVSGVKKTHGVSHTGNRVVIYLKPAGAVEAVPGAVQHHGKDELRDVVGFLDRSVHHHHGLLSASLQVSVVTSSAR